MIDPVCHMEVEPNSAAGSYEYKGETYYFCSRYCVEAFAKNPERFLNHPGPNLPPSRENESEHDQERALSPLSFSPEAGERKTSEGAVQANRSSTTDPV